jgi:nucleotide-binding universal stress UspA family protein
VSLREGIRAPVAGQRGPAVFDRVLCGIDGSPQALEALRQVECLRPAGGSLHLLTVEELRLAVHGGFAAPELYDQIQAAAEAALTRATDLSEATSSRLVDGKPSAALLREIQRLDATVVALGSHGDGRVLGIVLGSTATTLLHEAPCSVFLARPTAHAHRFPSSIVVGVDGSTASRSALEAALDIGRRLAAPVRMLAATGGKPVDFEGLKDVTDLEWDEQRPVRALVEASRRADLVVVGSRGLHGLAALGSVSERVAHEADCSVLVVRAT